MSGSSNRSDDKDFKSISIEARVSTEAGSAVDIRNVNSHIRSIRSKTGAGEVNYINSATSVTDNQLLAEIGYKQELKRQFSTFQVFGIAFSIMGLLPSIASVMGTGTVSYTHLDVYKRQHYLYQHY